jgi:Holliday junction resolvase RusA-like endonuclease
MLEFELPYPPSVNHYWRRVWARTLISRGGRAFRQEVCSILAGRKFEPLLGPLEVNVTVYPPDRRRRDIDNVLKSLLDSLEHGGAFHDDGQIVDLRARKLNPIPGGKVVVQIKGTEDRDAENPNDM